MSIPDLLVLLALMLFGMIGGLLVMKIAAPYIEYTIMVALSFTFGRWITDEPIVKGLMKCGYLTIVFINMASFFFIAFMEILF